MLKFFFKRNLDEEQKLYFDLMVDCYYRSLYESESARLYSRQYRKVSLSLLVFSGIIFSLSYFNLLWDSDIFFFIFHLAGLSSIIASGLYMTYNYVWVLFFFFDYNFIECDPQLKKSVKGYIFCAHLLFTFFFFSCIIYDFILCYDYTLFKSWNREF